MGVYVCVCVTELFLELLSNYFYLISQIVFLILKPQHFRNQFYFHHQVEITYRNPYSIQIPNSMILRCPFFH